MNQEREQANSVFADSLKVVVATATNPHFLFGTVFGVVIGGGICACLFVVPFQKNLKEREDQLESWSRLNQQMQQLTQDNRSMSQEELKKYVAINQAAATQFVEVEKTLHDRELRLTTVPTGFIMIPLVVLVVALGGIVLILKTLNARALATVEHVLHLAPREMVHEIVSRHIVDPPPRAGLLPPSQSD